MIKLEKFDGTKTYQFPSGKIATPEVIYAEYPGTKYFTHVLQVSGEVCQAIMNLSAMRAMHNIDESLNEAEAIEAIKAIMNQPQPEPEPSVEERKVAAMEFDILRSL